MFKKKLVTKRIKLHALEGIRAKDVFLHRHIFTRRSQNAPTSSRG